MSTDKDRLILTADGAASNNQSKTDRKAGIGYIISSAGTEITEQSQFLGQGELYTNNFAEYQAVIKGLEWIRQDYDLSSVSIDIHTDSQLLINQVRGEWSTSESHLLEQRNTLQGLVSECDECQFEHVSETNENLVARADSLASEATQQ
jgi:ribonuclease HI